MPETGRELAAGGCDCHVHVMMNGVSYPEAKRSHLAAPDEALVRACLEAYRQRGITFLRDGGDALGVSRLAKRLAPEYGIDYRSPIFAIHLKGRYGGIVGRAFETLGDYRELVLEAKAAGADFIKIMTTGILELDRFGVVTHEPLEKELVREMVRIAHGEGLAVMSHTNGDEAIRIALEAGVDSLEHGNYMEADTAALLAASGTVWVPTLVTIRNLIGEGRYPAQVLREIADHTAARVREAYRLGGKLAVGSDAGAYGVPHGLGALQEEQAFREILGDDSEVLRRLKEGEVLIRERFCRREVS